MGYLPNYAKVFSLRPEVMNAWANLISTVRGNIDRRRFELVTFAAAHEAGNTYCTLAHGKVLIDEFLKSDELTRIAQGSGSDALSDDEVAIMKFARKVARDASSVTSEDVQTIKACGLDDADVFDIVAAVSARAFFTRMLDGLGAVPDRAYKALDTDLLDALTVGRAVGDSPLEYLPE